jgi:hypothetical protein
MISYNPVLFMNLKLHELVPYLERLSRGGLEQVVQDIEMKLDWSKSTNVVGLRVAMFFDDFVKNFLRGNADEFGLDEGQ